MSASSHATWHELPAELEDDNKPLLGRSHFDKDSYRVQVTDLTQIWTEDLDKRGILKRARDEDASIDPSEDDGQFKILLQKLKDTIHGEKNTTLKLEKANSGREIRVSIICELPHPLEPLSWTMRLVRSPDTALSSEFIMPLLHSSSLQHRQVEELGRLLVEKDNAISKMLDKVESLGIDWSALFPNIGTIRSNRRDKRRDHITKNVRGLQTFEKDDWIASFAAKETAAINLRDLVREAFGSGFSSNRDNIMESIEPAQLLSRQNTAEPVTESLKPALRTGASAEDDDDDFQRQVTPPSAQKQRAGKASVSVTPQAKPLQQTKNDLQHDGHHSSTDEEDLNYISGHCGGLNNTKHSASATKDALRRNEMSPPYEGGMSRTGLRKAKLGRIGGSKSKDSSAEPSKSDETHVVTGHSSESDVPASATPAEREDDPVPLRRKFGRIGGTPAPKQAQVMVVEATPSPSPAPRKLGKLGGMQKPPHIQADDSDATRMPSPRKLGRIGGSRADTEEAPHIAPASDSQSQKPSPRKLGRIGGRSKDQDGTADSARKFGHAQTPTEDTSSASTLQANSQTNSKGVEDRTTGDDSATVNERAQRPEETAEQKANRKREELKRQLEEKSKAQHKKKRRF